MNRPSYQTFHKGMFRHKGVTFLELMAVMTIIAILTTIAYPSYLDQVRKSKRAVAKSALLDAANRQEQYFFDHKQYADAMNKLTGYTGYSGATILFDDNGSPTSDGTDAVYAVKVVSIDDDPEVCGGTPCFQLQAAPQNDQTHDACDTFSITSSNARNVINSTSTPASECW
jgi:type IV pilus assembly protein PilE